MPRVNRDLQRRMAARRERERRRPAADRRYRFGSPSDPAVEADDTLLEEGEETTNVAASPPRRSAPTSAEAAAGRSNAKAAVTPFSAYKSEYAYVGGDLRRVGLVIGSLLVILILLYFVLPH